MFRIPEFIDERQNALLDTWRASPKEKVTVRVDDEEVQSEARARWLPLRRMWPRVFSISDHRFSSLEFDFPSHEKSLVVNSYSRYGRSRVFEDSFNFGRVFEYKQSSAISLFPANDVVKLGEKLHQQSLPLGAAFVPSRRLLELWRSGLNSYLEEGLEDVSEADLFVLDVDQVELCQEFDRRLRDTIIKTAHMYSYQQRTVRLSVGKRFKNQFMVAVLERFLIRLDEGTMFFHALFSELERWLRSGEIIEGPWGRLFVDVTGDFILETVKPRKKIIKGFRRSDED